MTPEERKKENENHDKWDAEYEKGETIFSSVFEMYKWFKDKEFTIDFNGHGGANQAQDPQSLKRLTENCRDRILRKLDFNTTYHKEVIHELIWTVKSGYDTIRQNYPYDSRPINMKENLAYHRKQIHFLRTEAIKKNYAVDWSDMFYCGTCGEKYTFRLKDKNGFVVGPRGSQIGRGEFDSFCKFADGCKAMTTEVDVPNGQLVFANFFQDEKPYEIFEKYPESYSCKPQDNRPGKVEIFDPKDKWGEEFSLNSYNGIANRMQWLANTFNVLYAQTGNMSLGIFVSPSKDEIIMANAYYEDDLYEFINALNDGKSVEEANECARNSEYSQKYGWKNIHQESLEWYVEYIIKKKFKFVGGICCEMWRWMAADKTILEKHEIPHTPKQKIMVEGRERTLSEDIHVVEVIPGRWKLTHYYGTDEHSDVIYSHLKLIGENNEN